MDKKRKRLKDETGHEDGGETKKRKKEGVEYDDTKPDFLGNVIIKAKQKMDSKDSQNGCTYLIVGGSGSGKTTFLKHVFFNHVYLPQITPTKKDYIVVCFTKSEMSDALQEIHEKVLIVRELDVDIILWARELLEKYGKKYSFVFVLDDCIDIRFNKIIKHCFLTFRNWGITSIVSLQYAKDIPRAIRGTVYFACALHCGKDSAMAILESFPDTHIEGRTMAEKVVSYMERTKGYNSFFFDMLQNKVYSVDKNYRATEITERHPSVCAPSGKDEEGEEKDDTYSLDDYLYNRVKHIK